MGWCKYCCRNRPTEKVNDGYVCCTVCGKVLLEDNFDSEPTFFKDAGGRSSLAGCLTRSVETHMLSRERTLGNGRQEICYLMSNLEIEGGDPIINEAASFYRIAVEKNFTRGRRISLVAAACLYITCRRNKKAYLLIDFSEELRVNVYVLGAVFLQLCQLLRLEEHPIVQRLVDPSLFIKRFTHCLLQGKNDGVGKNDEVSFTALHILRSMKRDWMQTGRKPSGLCGAALYVSALSHGIKCSKGDIGRIVHICEATLTKRLIEFENTESGCLTIGEFIEKAEEFDREAKGGMELVVECGEKGKIGGITELLCKHKDNGRMHFRHGLCEKCYGKFVEISGGLQGGAEPPAFQRAEKERLAKLAAEGKGKDNELGVFDQEVEPFSVVENEKLNSDCSKENGVAKKCNAVEDGTCDDLGGEKNEDSLAGDESEGLSDIDDGEVDGYLHNEEEKSLKKIIWEEMNKEYEEEQRQKRAREEEAKQAYEANFQNCSESARELAASVATNLEMLRKAKRQKRVAEAKNAVPARNATEAIHQMLNKKRLSSKLNYDALGKLFDGSTDAGNTKKVRFKSDYNDDDRQEDNKGEKEFEIDYKDDKEQEDEYGEEDNDGGTYGDDYDLYNENEEAYGEEGYGYDEDY